MEQINDIGERLQFTYNAMEKAVSLAAGSSSTLKVFMAPEFLYRGRGGAYIHDLISGWEKAPDDFKVSAQEKGVWPGLFGYLKRVSHDSRFEHWLFVFGTAISASFQTKSQNGKLVWDTTKTSEIYNTALIQRGGLGHTDDSYASRKHYKATIDFIKTYLGAKAFTDGDVVPLDRMEIEPNETGIYLDKEGKETKKGYREGSAIFQINGINDKDGKPIDFGLEICLDHAASTMVFEGNVTYPKWGRIAAADTWVKIQLVPSGGMSLQTDSIRLLPPTPRSYAFNCDGLSTLGIDWQWGAHTQIWNGANAHVNKLIEANYAQNVSNTRLIKVDDDLYWAGRGIGIHASNLWDLGAGHIRVMQEMPL
jgi:hypothetical protein